MKSILFVCLGNICRSPLAEGIFAHKLQQADLQTAFRIDSAGTSGWHEGELPDRRMMQTAKQYGLLLTHRSRPLLRSDFHDFDLLLAMDASVLREMQRRAPAGTAHKLQLMRAYDALSSGADVEDPYYQDQYGFEICYQVLDECCERLLEAFRP